MKTIPLLATATALTALFALPVRLEIAGTALLAAILAALLHQDYRRPRVLRLPSRHRNAARTPFRAPTLRVQTEPHRLAA